MNFVLGAGLACLVAACASASAPVESAGSTAVVATAPATEVASAGPAVSTAAAGNKRVCRKMAVMGSIMPKRVCASEAEWAATDAIALEQQEELDRQRRSASGARTFE